MTTLSREGSQKAEKRSKVGVVSIIYEEPYWTKTRRLIEQLNLPTVFVDRSGVGSLAKAYNRGFERLLATNELDYVWMISNVEFKSRTLNILVDAMDKTGMAGIHPSFHSDHPHTRPGAGVGVKECSFFEFTAPIVRADVFTKIPLDEQMPYWGHDFDWGYRVRHLTGLKIGIDFNTFVKHEYIRHTARRLPNPVTTERQRRRRATNDSTKDRLVELYGKDWAFLLDAKNYQNKK